MDRERRGFVGGASALALLSASSAAFAQPAGAPPDQAALEETRRPKFGMAKPASRAELLAVLQAAADSETVAVLDPTTDITVDKTVEVVQRASSSRAWGVIGNGAKIRSAISDGTPVVKYRVVASDPKTGAQSRGLTIQTLDIIGSLKDGPGLMLHAPSGMGPIYRAVIRDNSTSFSGGLGALHIKGAVFELLVAGHVSENNRQNGVAIEHEHGAIASNCMIHGLNSSRNSKAGLYTLSNSVDVVQGSFVNNGDCGINAPKGLRSAAFINGENTGQFVIRVGGYANLHNCEASTDGKTFQHDVATGRPAGVPTEALVDYSGFNQYSNDLKMTGDCKFTTYNGGTGYLARIRQASGTSNVWLEPWMDRKSVRRSVESDTLPAIRQVMASRD
jgi:hypothetical protein